MDIFKGQKLLEFSDRFRSDDDCREYLSGTEWAGGYTCRKCGHGGCQVRRDFSRTCNRCCDTESAGVGTLFHKVKFGLRKAFFICFEMSTTTKSLSASYMSVRYGISENTARLFMHKVREEMKPAAGTPWTAMSTWTSSWWAAGRTKSRAGATTAARRRWSARPADARG